MFQPRILLVDDDPGVIHVLSGLLSQEGQLSFALSGADALTMARRMRPDLVLLDAGLPDLDGFEVCRSLQADPQTTHIPVMFVTGQDDAASEARALQLGAIDFLRKPLQALRVQARVRHQLRRLQALEAEPVGLDPMQGRQTATVLVVDDDLATVELVREALEGSGLRLQCALDAAHAGRIMAEQTPDLVLLDMLLPDDDGLALCRRWQCDPTLSRVPVVFITQYADPEREAAALEAGAIDFVAKPLTRTVLLARVRNVLRLRRRQDDELDAARRQWQRIGQSRMAELVSALGEGIIAIDAADRVVLFNPAASRLLTLAPADVLGRTWSALQADIGANPALPAPPSADPMALPADRRIVVRRPDGSEQPLSVSWSLSGHGAQWLRIALLHDLSAREMAERAEAARRLAEVDSRAKSMMVSFLAHEIANPLNGILGLGELMVDDDREPLGERQLGRLLPMMQSARHLNALMRDVIDLHRMGAGQFSVRQVPQAWQPVLAGVLQSCEALARKAGVQLRLLPAAAAAQRVWVRVDDTRLRQCLLNVIGNAIKYNRRGGQVVVSVGVAGDTVRMAVRDDGLGLDAEQRARLFRPFDRLGRDAMGPGSGLGLVLTRQLLEAMGGGLEVDSQPGRGSQFTLVLMAAAADGPSQNGAPGPEEPGLG